MQLADDLPGLGVLVVTSADRLHADWRAGAGPAGAAARPPATLERLLAPLAARRAADHRARRPSGDARLARQRHRPPGLSARRRPLRPVGRHPGPLSRRYEIDAEAIIDRAARACRDRLQRADERAARADARRGPLDPVRGRLRPRRQQRRDPAAAAPGLRRASRSTPCSSRIIRATARWRGHKVDAGSRSREILDGARGARRARPLRGGAQRLSRRCRGRRHACCARSRRCARRGRTRSICATR